MKKIILVASIVLIFVAAVMAVGYSNNKTALTTDERAQAREACAKCHRNPDNLADASVVHQVHQNADCITCHADARGLKTADQAHNILQWAGIGIAAVTVAGLALNFIVAKKRLKNRDAENGKPNG